MHMNKPEQCKEVLATMERLRPGSEQAVLVRAAMLHRAKQTKACEEMREQAAASSPDAPRPLLSPSHHPPSHPRQATRRSRPSGVARLR